LCGSSAAAKLETEDTAAEMPLAIGLPPGLPETFSLPSASVPPAAAVDVSFSPIDRPLQIGILDVSAV
jgi:hypothetical protein